MQVVYNRKFAFVDRCNRYMMVNVDNKVFNSKIRYAVKCSLRDNYHDKSITFIKRGFYRALAVRTMDLLTLQVGPL